MTTLVEKCYQLRQALFPIDLWMGNTTNQKLRIERKMVKRRTAAALRCDITFALRLMAKPPYRSVYIVGAKQCKQQRQRTESVERCRQASVSIEYTLEMMRHGLRQDGWFRRMLLSWVKRDSGNAIIAATLLWRCLLNWWYRMYRRKCFPHINRCFSLHFIAYTLGISITTTKWFGVGV